MSSSDNTRETDLERFKRYKKLQARQYNDLEEVEARKKNWDEIADRLWETPGEKRP